MISNKAVKVVNAIKHTYQSNLINSQGKYILTINSNSFTKEDMDFIRRYIALRVNFIPNRFLEKINIL